MKVASRATCLALLWCLSNFEGYENVIPQKSQDSVPAFYAIILSQLWIRLHT